MPISWPSGPRQRQCMSGRRLSCLAEIPAPFCSRSHFRFVLKRRKGPVCTDIDGHSYIDYVGEYSAGIYGHSHPKILAAVSEGMASGLNIGAQHVREVAFAEAVTQRFDLAARALHQFGHGSEHDGAGGGAKLHGTTCDHADAGRAIMVERSIFPHGASPVNAPFECVHGTFQRCCRRLAN